MGRDFLTALRSGKPMLMGGAVGSELIKLGWNPATCADALLCRTHPHWVRQVHQSYADAGAEVHLSNTFGLFSLPPTEIEPVLNLAADLLGGLPGFRLLALGPWPILPLRGIPDIFDAILLETFSSPAIFESAKALEATGLPILASISFRRLATGETQSFSGHTPEFFAEAARNSITALGSNCGANLELADSAEIVRRFRSVTNLPLFVRPNASTPRIAGDGLTWPTSSEEFGNFIPEFLAAGATMIGGCCGIGPDHIRRTAKVLKTG